MSLFMVITCAFAKARFTRALRDKAVGNIALVREVVAFLTGCLKNRAMGQMIENMKSNENQVKYRIFDSRFNGTIFSMIHGISAVLFKILKIWSRRS